MIMFQSVRNPAEADGCLIRDWGLIWNKGTSLDDAALFLEDVADFCARMASGASTPHLVSYPQISARVVGSGGLARCTHPKVKADLRAYTEMHPNDFQKRWEFFGPLISVIRRVGVQEATTRADLGYYDGLDTEAETSGKGPSGRGRGGRGKGTKIPGAPLQTGGEEGKGAKGACWTCGLTGHRAADCPSAGKGGGKDGGGGGKDTGRGGGKTGGKDPGKHPGKDGGKTPGKKGKLGKDGKPTGKSPGAGGAKAGPGAGGKDAGKAGKGGILAGPVTADALLNRRGIPLTVGELANKFSQLAKASALRPSAPAEEASEQPPAQHSTSTTPPVTGIPLTQLNTTLTSSNSKRS